MLSMTGSTVLLLLRSASAFNIGLSPRALPIRGASPSCSIAVFGASGGTGSEAVLQALERGEDVTCLVRDAAKLKSPRTTAGFTEGAAFASDKLAVKTGTVTSQSDVNAVFEAASTPVTGVVIALGGKTSDVGPTMLQDGTSNVIAAMKSNGVARISIVTTIGAGDSMEQAPWAFRLLMMTVMSSIMADKNKQEELFVGGADAPGADLEFCIVRPGGLKSEPPNGVVNVVEVAGSINRADVAAFCLDAVIEPEFKFLKQAVSISSDKGAGFDSVLADKTKSRMAAS
jgi:putative NADH-flavin reductase